MKKIIFFLLISTTCFSQHFEKKIDDFTKNTLISCSTYKQDALMASSLSKEHNIYLTFKAEISAKGNKYIYLNLEALTTSIFCFSRDKGKIIFLMEDDSQIKLNQTSELKCDTNSIVSYELYQSNLTELLNGTIKKIRVQTTDGYFDCTIKDKKKQLIKDTLVMFSMNIQ